MLMMPVRATTWQQAFPERYKNHSMLISIKQKHKIIKSQNEHLKLKIRDNKLEVVKNTTYLGLQIDCSLDWKGQFLPKSPRQLDF